MEDARLAALPAAHAALIAAIRRLIEHLWLCLAEQESGAVAAAWLSAFTKRIFAGAISQFR